MSTTLHDPAGNRTVQCPNCRRVFEENRLNPIEDLEERISPGEVVPVGECPACAALCHLLYPDSLPGFPPTITVTHRMGVAGRNIASQLTYARAAKFSQGAGGCQSWKDWTESAERTQLPNQDLIHAYLGNKIPAVVAIYIAMAREEIKSLTPTVNEPCEPAVCPFCKTPEPLKVNGHVYTQELDHNEEPVQTRMDLDEHQCRSCQRNFFV